MNIAKKIAEELEIKVTQVEAAVKLIDEGCTIPFIARYRKEVTGALNDEQLRNLDERLKYLRNLEDRKTQVIASIEEQGKLTEELNAAITAAETMVLVEDLYRPYKQKRRTRATIAKEKGLEPLAQFIFEQQTTEDVEVKAAEFISDEEGKEVDTAQDAIAGALDIIAEQISDVADYRTYIRDITMKEGKLVVTAKDEKALVYEEYCDKVDEMVLGTIETVEEKFVIVNIGKTFAMMKKSAQIPTEHYKEGDNILVVITEVNKETKGAQVLVSRATPVFVRRLFEREVPEIYNGIIEIKAIARDPGERCKIAVYSHNENIDPIGACIGPRGSRVQTIIEELHGEKIDIFEWSDNISELIANALSPSVGVAVIPNENVKDGLIVVVPDNQLSLAIGKRGKNARLAVKLTNHKIDIKSESEMQELGIDYMAISAKMQEEYEEKKAKERAYKQQQKIEELKSNETDIENIDVADFTYEDEEVDAVEEHSQDTLFEKENTVEEKEVDEMEELARIAKQNRKEKTAADVKEYTSKFESMADASNKQEEPQVSKPKKEKVEEEKKPVEVKKFNYEDMKPIYSEEELAEIEEQEYEDENAWDDDVDYEEYDEYYDD